MGRDTEVRKVLVRKDTEVRRSTSGWGPVGASGDRSGQWGCPCGPGPLQWLAPSSLVRKDGSYVGGLQQVSWNARHIMPGHHRERGPRANERVTRLWRVARQRPCLGRALPDSTRPFMFHHQ